MLKLMVIYLTKIEPKESKFVAEVRYKDCIFDAVDRTPEGVIKQCQEHIRMIHMLRSR